VAHHHSRISGGGRDFLHDHAAVLGSAAPELAGVPVMVAMPYQ
jgi:hypothetical protein